MNAKKPDPERILIVEDDAATRIGLSELVRAWGYETDEAAIGEAALSCIAAFRPSIIVSDLVMPGMSGLDLLRELRDQSSVLAFVMLTAQGSVDTAVAAIKDGAYDYLTNPVDPERLRILLDKIAERLATRREPRADGQKKAYNQEPEQCWECYNCVKICPVQAIEARHYADIMPLGSSTIPLRGTDNIMWTIKFRDQKTVKRFKFPTRTTAEGSIDAFKGFTLPSNVADLKKPGFFTGAARTE